MQIFLCCFCIFVLLPFSECVPVQGSITRSSGSKGSGPKGPGPKGAGLNILGGKGSGDKTSGNSAIGIIIAKSTAIPKITTLIPYRTKTPATVSINKRTRATKTIPRKTTSRPTSTKRTTVQPFPITTSTKSPTKRTTSRPTSTKRTTVHPFPITTSAKSPTKRTTSHTTSTKSPTKRTTSRSTSTKSPTKRTTSRPTSTKRTTTRKRKSTEAPEKTTPIPPSTFSPTSKVKDAEEYPCPDCDINFEDDTVEKPDEECDGSDCDEEKTNDDETNKNEDDSEDTEESDNVGAEESEETVENSDEECDGSNCDKDEVNEIEVNENDDDESNNEKDDDEEPVPENPDQENNIRTQNEDKGIARNQKDTDTIDMIRFLISCSYEYGKLSLNSEKENIKNLKKQIKSIFATDLWQAGDTLSAYDNKIQLLRLNYSQIYGVREEFTEYVNEFTLIKQNLDNIVNNIISKLQFSIEDLESLASEEEYTNFYNSFLEFSKNSKRVCLDANKIGINAASYIGNSMNIIEKCMKGWRIGIRKNIQAINKFLAIVLPVIDKSIKVLPRECTKDICKERLVEATSILRSLQIKDDTIGLRLTDKIISIVMETAKRCVRNLEDYPYDYLRDLAKCMSF